MVFVPLTAVGTVGVPVSAGLAERTVLPVPVEVVTPVPPLATANVAERPAAVPEVFWLKVGHVNVPVLKFPEVGVPSAGVTNVGLVAKTKDPEPVSSVTAAAKLALEGVPKNVATPVPRLVIPVPPLATGRVPVTLVAKLTNVVEVVPVPPLATGSVPVTPVVRGNPVKLVAVPLEGVPNTPPLTTGAPADPTLTANAVATPVPKPDTPVLIGKPVALVKVPLDGVPNTPPFTTGAPAVPTLTAKAVATPVPRPDTPVLIGKPVAFVSVTLEGVPKAGVTSVGDVANTKEPLPVSSVTVAAKLAEEGVAKNVATPVPKPETPVEMGRPVAFVNVAEDGVPKIGVTSVGEVDNTTLPVPVEVVTPVPPFKTAKVPATVTAPEVAVAGVNPVEPKLMVDTPSTTLEATLT